MSVETLTPAAKALRALPRPARWAGLHLILAIGFALAAAQEAREQARDWTTVHREAMDDLDAARRQWRERI